MNQIPPAIARAFAASRLTVTGYEESHGGVLVFYTGKEYADPAQAVAFKALRGWYIAGEVWQDGQTGLLFREG